MENMLPIMTEYRRALHRMPELGAELPKTRDYVRNALCALRCAVFAPTPDALCAFFDAGQPRTLAFRADMDALPIEENTGLSFASAHPGRMHACGHDGHMALLLGLAQALNAKTALPCNVLLIFEPAEETTGGALAICESGVLEEYRVQSIFGAHIWPGLPAGAVATRSGPMMAQCCEVHVNIAGKSAHMSRAAEGADALYAAAAFITRLYASAAAATPKSEARILKFGCMQSGTVQNALSAQSELHGTMRVFSEGMRAQLIDCLQAGAAAAEKETGCKVSVSLSPGYPPVVNDAALYERVSALLGAGLREAPLSMAGEDFSFYQARVPGVFFFLGAGRDAPLHAADFDFEESALAAGLALYERLLYL